MSSHISLASPSSVCRSSSTSVLLFLVEAGGARSWALCSWAVWQARQCLARAWLRSVHAGQDHSAELGRSASAGKDEEGDSGDSSSFRTLRRLPAWCSAGTAAGGSASVVGEGLRAVAGLRLTSAGGTSLRLQGTG